MGGASPPQVKRLNYDPQLNILLLVPGFPGVHHCQQRLDDRKLLTEFIGSGEDTLPAARVFPSLGQLQQNVGDCSYLVV